MRWRSAPAAARSSSGERIEAYVYTRRTCLSCEAGLGASWIESFGSS